MWFVKRGESKPDCKAMEREGEWEWFTIVGNLTFFAKYARIKPVLPKAAQLSITYLITKSVVLHLLDGPDTLLRDRKRKEPSTGRESNPRPLEFLLSRRALYRSATTTALVTKLNTFRN